MKVLDSKTKFAHLGKPGTIFSKGFERRLKKIKNRVDIENKIILDLGTGEGVWLTEFLKLTPPENLYASEYDEVQVLQLKSNLPKIEGREFLSENIKRCGGEDLAFESGFFEIVFQNEVLEHVADDEKTLEECYRVLKSGGRLIFFTPNRAWPFEQHGMFFRGRYYWGNIPFLPWMPDFIFRKFAPHVKNYTWGSLRKKLEKAGFEIEYHTRIFPGFDGLKSRFGLPGKILAGIIHFLEKTPLKFFGISHFVVAKKP